MKNFWKSLFVLLCVAILVGVDCTIDDTMAYISDQTDTANRFTIGNVAVDIIEEFNPAPPVVGTVMYGKKVQIKNSGTVPAFMRVNLKFSNTDVANIAKVSADNGSTWWRLYELQAHLPSGWVYIPSPSLLSGYYYYTEPIQPGASTPPLITNVTVDFINKTADTNQTINQTPRDYDISVYAEGIQQMKLDGSELNTGFSSAWTDFLNLK